MIRLRNSVKAIIIENGKILFNKMVAKDSEEAFYTLPGGGQDGGETFVDALKRECMEELGSEVEVGEIALIREYIGKNHEFAYKHANMHQIEYMFRCKLLSPIDLKQATSIDTEQVGFEWLELARLKEYSVYPKVLKNALDENGNVTTPVYIGDVN